MASNTNATKQIRIMSDSIKKHEEQKEELVKFHQVKNTPFTIVEIENKFKVVMGDYRLTEAFNTLEEAKKDAERMDWNRIMQVIFAINNKFQKIKEAVNEDNKILS